MMRMIWCFLFTAAVVAQPGRGPAPVGTTSAITKSIQSSMRLTGIVKAKNDTILASEIRGRVAIFHILPGVSFSKDDLILELDRTYLEYQKEAAEFSMEEAKANWDLATLQQQRSVNMFEKKVISQDDFDTFKLNMIAAKARFEQTREVLRQLEYQVDQTLIRAPYDGILTEQHVFVGSWVRQGDAVATLVSTRGAEVWVDLPEQYYSSRLAGNKVEVSLPNHKNTTITGVIRALVPQSNTNSHTFPVIIDIAHDSRIGFGMMVKTNIPIGRFREVLLVPKDAVIYQGNQASVWMVHPDNSIHMEPVTTGQSAGLWIEVSGKIKTGDVVITRGNERLFPGMTVAPTQVEYTDETR